MSKQPSPQEDAYPSRWFGRLRRSIKRRGLTGTIALAASELRRFARERPARKFDRQLGTDTFGLVELGHLDIQSGNRERGVQYQPTPTPVFKRAVSDLAIDPSLYTFVDFGSGKGRILLLAAIYGFRRVIGVEFARELHVAAESNIEVFRARKRTSARIESICMDATEFPIPEEPAVFYFFNPFDEVIMRQVLARIEASLVTHPRDVRFIYYNPVLPHVFDGFGFARENILFVPLHPSQR